MSPRTPAAFPPGRSVSGVILPDARKCQFRAPGPRRVGGQPQRHRQCAAFISSKNLCPEMVSQEAFYMLIQARSPAAKAGI